MKRKFKVTNMMCASCVNHVKKAVEKLDGINNVEVNLLTESMNVDYDERKNNDQEIIKSILKEGYGCSIYRREIKVDNTDLSKMRRRIAISLFFLILLLYVAMGHMINLPLPKVIIKEENSFFFALTQLIFVLPIVILNFSYFKNGFKKLVLLKPNMDSLIAIGAFASLIYGVFATIMIIVNQNNREIVLMYRHDLYFESAGTILTLITVGKYLETKSKKRTTDSLEKIMALTPKTAIIEINNTEKKVSQEEIKLGDVVIIKLGNVIPVDGIIVDGTASIDEAIITGESMPIEKGINNNVIAGSKVINGFIKIKATSVNGETTIDRILDLVEEAASSKAPISRLADKISSIFVPIVILIAVVSSLIWLIANNPSMALNTFISVLVISCPCALGLATPVAIMVATGKAAENNILIKSAESLELCHKIDTIILDKTGTITKGEMVVNNIYKKSNELMAVSYSLERKSNHPLSNAIIKYSKENNINSFTISEIENVPGLGIKGKNDNNIYYIGNAKFMEQNGVVLSDDDKTIINDFSSVGETVISVAKNKELLGIISFKDEVRSDSEESISLIKKEKIDIIMATGDNDITANAIKNEIGIDKVYAKIKPEEKAIIIGNLQKDEKVVCFVGDGINDAVALTKANIGIAIGAGSDIALSSADVILTRSSLSDVLILIRLSKKTINNIKMSLFWAFFYNCIGILIATGIFYPMFSLKLNPMIASLAMSLSSFSVVLNALRLKLFNKKKV